MTKISEISYFSVDVILVSEKLFLNRSDPATDPSSQHDGNLYCIFCTSSRKEVTYYIKQYKGTSFFGMFEKEKDFF
jgi:hypothetical protein